MTMLSVGQPYVAGAASYPEGVQYNYRSGGHELLLSLRTPTAAEVRDVGQGAAEFALYAAPPLIMLLYRFGSALPWSDAPFTVHLAPPDERTSPPPDLDPATHALLTIILVDAATGLVRALRALTFSPAFTAALHDAIRRQAAAPWDPAAYDAALARLYRRYPTTANLVRAAQHRSAGGA